VAARDAVARSLRAAATPSPTALHVLVLTVQDLELAAVPEQPALVAAARRLGRAMTANDLHESSHLDGLARARASGSGGAVARALADRGTGRSATVD
jgi:hypothetical protein